MSGRGTRSERIYGALLVAYPRTFREEYGPQMVQAFGDLCAEERERAGLTGLLALWARTVLDLFKSAASERARTVPRDTFVIPFAGSPRMTRLGGMAAIGGAICALLATFLSDVGAFYADEPILNAISAYQDGGSSYSPLIMLLHPIVAESLGTLSGLLFATAWLGLYALVARRSGRPALAGGALMCLSAVALLAFGVSNAYRMSVVFGGWLGRIETDPPMFVFEVASLAFLLGALILSLAVARTRALRAWSALPLLLMFVGLALRLVLLRFGLPMQNFPEAAREGVTTLLVVETPVLVTNLGWMLLGCLMLRSSRTIDAGQDLAIEIPQSSGTKE